MNYLNQIKKAVAAILFGTPKAEAHGDSAAELNKVAHFCIPATEAPPAGFVWIEDGKLKREADLTDYEREREALLLPLATEWAEHWLSLADLKSRFDEAFDQLEAASQRNTRREAAGKKPSMTLYSLDRSFSLSRKRADTVRYEEDKLLAAKVLVDACVARWAEGGSEEIKQIAELAFTKNAKGEYSRSGMVRLRRINSDDPEWLEAMRQIAAAELVDGVSSYLLVSVRDQDGRYHPLPLDIASVRPYRMPVSELVAGGAA